MLHARHLALRQLEELAPCGRRVDLREDLRRAPDRGQRILQLVPEIGRERFGEARVLLQPVRELLQGARQLGDLVPPA